MPVYRDADNELCYSCVCTFLTGFDMATYPVDKDGWFFSMDLV